MGSTGTLPQLKQIAVAASREGKLVGPDDLYSDRKQLEEDLFKSAFTTPHPHVGKEWSDADRVSPYPLLVPEYFVENAKQLQQALAIAVANIVERWAEPSDSLSQRMPLQLHEDTLLRVCVIARALETLLTPDAIVDTPEIQRRRYPTVQRTDGALEAGYPALEYRGW